MTYGKSLGERLIMIYKDIKIQEYNLKFFKPLNKVDRSDNE